MADIKDSVAANEDRVARLLRHAVTNADPAAGAEFAKAAAVFQLAETLERAIAAFGNLLANKLQR